MKQALKDIEVILPNVEGQLALLGDTLGQNGISLDGGGVFGNGSVSIAHYLVEDADKAKEVLAAVGITVSKINKVIVQKLRQDVPGQLGLFCRRLADNGVNILVQYSDHDNQLIIVPDDYEKAEEVSKVWMKEWW